MPFKIGDIVAVRHLFTDEEVFALIVEKMEGRMITPKNKMMHFAVEYFDSNGRYWYVEEELKRKSNG